MAQLDDPAEFADQLGPCCTCGTSAGVRNIMMVALRAPQPGKGWGCVVCDLPADGAIAVLCDACVERPVKAVCDGYPKEAKRVPIESLPAEAFDHDMAKHAADEQGG